jgi:hypothetical protein
MPLKLCPCSALVAPKVQEAMARGTAPVLIFDDRTGDQIDVDVSRLPLARTCVSRDQASVRYTNKRLSSNVSETVLVSLAPEFVAPHTRLNQPLDGGAGPV